MLNMIKAVLIDLSGTLHIDNQIIPGAIEALKLLRKSDLKIKFVTNTTKESKNILYNRLQKLGFDVQLDEIHTSLIAARKVIDEKKLNPLLLVSKEALEDFEGLNYESNHNAVVIGLAPSEFHYDKLNQAFRLLLDGAPLIAIHAGKYYKRPDGLALGPGCFVKGLEYSAKCTAQVIGKPTEGFFKSAVDNIQPSECVMIGDDVTDDIDGAQKIGMKGILVQTGKYQSGDEAKINPAPWNTVPSFVEAVQKLLGHNENIKTKKST
ncbi:haloacid dehalogenase-like hydrolase domain-containing protein 2 [Onthophagus taurus]|uniref:haloacid dehalogenase-like hydrolase domain-containing protein 2 n=1 Tax=Onthophagus taurus TaxID=166361 RepID=UPI0039BE19F3